MPTNRQLIREYTDRALRLIRFGNGQMADIDAELRRLARELAGLIAVTDFGRRGEVADLIREVDAAIAARYGSIASRQSATLSELVNLEAAWARRAGRYRAAPSERALRIAASRLLVMGMPTADAWSSAGDNLSLRIAAEIRTAAEAGDDLSQIRTRVIGSGPQSRQRGGVLERARQQARAINQTEINAAAETGRHAAWAVAGVDALMWISVLDSNTTPGCVLRNGKLYSLDYQPLGHDVPIERPPPRHWKCRSLLAPQVYDDRLRRPDDGGESRFDDYLDSLTVEEQDDLLGAGRADLYRRGVITQSDLVNQAGEILTLAQLRELVNP